MIYALSLAKLTTLLVKYVHVNSTQLNLQNRELMIIYNLWLGFLIEESNGYG